MIVVLRLRKFDFESPSIPWPIRYAGKEIGFLPVFDSMEAAKVEFPDGPFIECQEIRPTPPGPGE